MTEENMKKLFQSYSKLEDKAQANKTGTGLGLKICKQLLEVLGGTVKIKSKPEEGSSFVIQLKSMAKF